MLGLALTLLLDGAVPVPEEVAVAELDEADLSRAARAAGVGEPAGAEFVTLNVEIPTAEELPAPELDDVELSFMAARAAGAGVPDGAAELKVGAVEDV